jgi:hypothetical protein
MYYVHTCHEQNDEWNHFLFDILTVFNHKQ